MNKLRVAIFAAAFASGAPPTYGDDGSIKPAGEPDGKNATTSQAKPSRALPTRADKEKAVDAAFHADTYTWSPEKPLMGDFKSPNDPVRWRPRDRSPTPDRKPTPDSQ
jgi:hypothetical protein